MHSPIAEKPEILKSLRKQWINKNSQISNALTKSDKPLLDSICDDRVRVSQSVSVTNPDLSKQQNESSWFWHGSFLRPILHWLIRKFGYLQNKGTSL